MCFANTVLVDMQPSESNQVGDIAQFIPPLKAYFRMHLADMFEAVGHQPNRKCGYLAASKTHATYHFKLIKLIWKESETERKSRRTASTTRLGGNTWSARAATGTRVVLFAPKVSRGTP